MYTLFRQTLSRVRDHARRAADWQTFRLLSAPPSGIITLRLKVHGQTVPIAVRGQTLDMNLAAQVLGTDPEYRLPTVPGFSPKVILDLGANIGLTSVYFATLFPDARIWAFEPYDKNLDLLQQNVYPFGGRVTVVPLGVSNRSTVKEYFPSDNPANFGGGSFHGNKGSQPIRLPVDSLANLMRDYHIPKVVDLIKVDVEGDEGEALAGAPDVWAGAHVVIGELHDHCDYQVLGALHRTHQIEHSKRWDRSCSMFTAVRRPTPILLQQ